MTVKQYLHMTVRRKILLMMRGRLCSLKKAGNGIFIFITTKEDVLALGKENDLDNYKQFYEKAFLDSIQSKIWSTKEKKLIHNEKAIIENDNMNYIVRLEHEIQIKDYRELIINIKRYNKQ